MRPWVASTFTRPFGITTGGARCPPLEAFQHSVTVGRLPTRRAHLLRVNQRGTGSRRGSAAAPCLPGPGIPPDGVRVAGVGGAMMRSEPGGAVSREEVGPMAAGRRSPTRRLLRARRRLRAELAQLL